MRPVPIFGFLLLFLLLGCDKVKEDINTQYSAQIVGFDLNCSTCIVSFPDNSLEIKGLFGESPDNYFQIVNLAKGSFKIGQKLKVNVRKAEDSELNACITLYPSDNHKSLYALDYQNYTDLKFYDTLVLAYKDCFYDRDGQSYICFDTVLTDSRCPIEVECVWAGEAIARFKIEKSDSSPVFIDLHEGVNDTVISGYKFSFIKLLPYPSYGNQTRPEDYKARIVIKSN
jgi:hypothetical protein